ncbi:hypothetical protein BAR24066_07387 [Burkholderia arboris]|uniref:Uncharacterized protein n=1 Tax=Burkholderia arboris TaxID=488730 RepID=A0A9Q9SRR4_9BURK|nr:hypothetical protein BAR24066_07387 [Burkholderia arboris]
MGQPLQAAPRGGHRQCFAAADDARERRAACEAGRLEEAAEHRRHEVQGGHRVLCDDVGQIIGVTVRAGRGHDERGAIGQRPEEFPDRHVEAERRLLQHDIPRIQAVGSLHPGQAVDQRIVLVLHALGQAGGARRIDDVGEMARGQPERTRRQIVRRQAVPRRRRDTHVDQRVLRQMRFTERVGKRVASDRIDEHDGGCGVGQDMREARAGIGGIERHVGTAGLEDTKQRDDHRRAAVEADGDRRIGRDVEFDQVTREPVGARIEFGIGETLAAGDQRGGIGCTPNLRLEQPMQILAPVIWRIRRVQRVDQQRLFVARYEIDCPHRDAVVLARTLDEVEKTRCMARHGDRIEHVAVVPEFDIDRRVFPELRKQERQTVLRPGQPLDVRGLTGHFDGMPQEQRIDAHVDMTRIDPVTSDHVAQRESSVTHHAPERFADLAQRRRNRHVGLLERHRKRNDLGELPGDVERFARPVQERRADDRMPLARDTHQIDAGQRSQAFRRRQRMLLRGVQEPRLQGRRERAADRRDAAARLDRVRMVGHQRHQCRTVHLLARGLPEGGVPLVRRRTEIALVERKRIEHDPVHVERAGRILFERGIVLADALEQSNRSPAVGLQMVRPQRDQYAPGRFE